MDETKGILKLVMTFETDEQKKVSLSLDDPKEDLTEGEIKDCMQSIVATNIFSPNGATIAKMVEAKIVNTNTQSYDLA